LGYVVDENQMVYSEFRGDNYIIIICLKGECYGYECFSSYGCSGI
jgi:hypothetical protein